MEIKSYAIGYKCPSCLYIQINETIEPMIDKPKNIGMSNIKCPVCNNEEFFKNWEIVKYPIVKK